MRTDPLSGYQSCLPISWLRLRCTVRLGKRCQEGSTHKWVSGSKPTQLCCSTWLIVPAHSDPTFQQGSVLDYGMEPFTLMKAGCSEGN